MESGQNQVPVSPCSMDRREKINFASGPSWDQMIAKKNLVLVYHPSGSKMTLENFFNLPLKRNKCRPLINVSLHLCRSCNLAFERSNIHIVFFLVFIMFLFAHLDMYFAVSIYYGLHFSNQCSKAFPFLKVYMYMA